MGWRHDWPEYQPRPKAARLPAARLAELHLAAQKFVGRSQVLRELVEEVQLARGRLYFWRGDDDLMARLTPLSRVTVLLEAPWRSGWSEASRGALMVVLRTLERDRHGTFHGLGALASRRRGGAASVQELLHRDLGVPLAVLAEPRYWYTKHRTPKIAELDRERQRALVRFESFSAYGPFHGTCLYACVDGEWDCYTIKPSAAASIATAEAWLEKRDWEDWG